MTKILADALVPIFAGLLLGYIAGLNRAMDNVNVKTLITFVMSFAIPCSLFLAVARTPREALREQAATALVLAIVYVVLYAGSFLWGRSREHFPPTDNSVLALTLGFPNTAAVGLPLLASVFGPRATVTVATSIAIGSITVSPLTLAILEASRSGRGLAFKVHGSFPDPLMQKGYCLGPSIGAGVLRCRVETTFLYESIAYRDGISCRRFRSGADRSGGLRTEVQTRGKRLHCSSSQERDSTGTRAWVRHADSSLR